MYSPDSSLNPEKKFAEPSSPPTPTPTATGIPVSSAGQFHSPPANQPWSSGLCDCFSDCENCCITFWCPCITFGQISEIVDKGSSSCALNGALYTLIALVIGCPCFYSCFYRTKMRQQHHLEDGYCGDCMVHCCCESCALCQEYRELKHRGYDMSLGWYGNVEMRNRELGMTPMAPAAPVVEHGMTR